MTARVAREPRAITSADVADFLYYEAELLDSWQLEAWESLLTDDAAYYVPTNDRPDGGHHDTLFYIADDRVRLHERVLRVKSANCHAEHPKSRMSRMISNVRIVGVNSDLVSVSSNFVCYRFRRHERVFTFVGTYKHVLRIDSGSFRIRERRVLLASEELGSLGSISFIL